jgi:cytochrome c peroxidase
MAVLQPSGSDHCRPVTTSYCRCLRMEAGAPGKFFTRNRLLAFLLLVALGIPRVFGQQSASLVSTGHTVPAKQILGLPPVPIPGDNPATQETIVLGQQLFFDPILSGNGKFSCATCHKPQFGFADDKPVSPGATGKTSHRNVPAIVNAAYFASLFWDGRISTLEQQVKEPIESPEEMASVPEAVVRNLNADPTYRQEFTGIWGAGPITFEMVETSIAAYERILLSGNSSFDRWKYGHDENAVSDSVKRGFAIFISPKKANCAVCHTVGDHYALFTDNKFHDIGVGVDSNRFADPGRFGVTGDESDRGKFKTPSLRNVSLTAPYMHDGSLKDLKQVLDFYIGAGNSHSNLDKEIHPLDFLTGQERRDLLSFLNSLNGQP